MEEATEKQEEQQKKPFFTEEQKKEAIAKGEAYYDEKEGKWKNYHPQKGKTPPWEPFKSPGSGKRKGMTIKEKKFLYMLSATGSLSKAFRSTYKVRAYPDKKIESARVYAMAAQVLKRLRKNYPDFVREFAFEDVNPGYLRKRLMSIDNDEGSTNMERIAALKLMGQLIGAYSDKNIVEVKMKEVKDTLYSESTEDMPEERREQVSRIEVEEEFDK